MITKCEHIDRKSIDKYVFMCGSLGISFGVFSSYDLRSLKKNATQNTRRVNAIGICFTTFNYVQFQSPCVCIYTQCKVFYLFFFLIRFEYIENGIILFAHNITIIPILDHIFLIGKSIRRCINSSLN